MLLRRPTPSFWVVFGLWGMSGLTVHSGLAGQLLGFLSKPQWVLSSDLTSHHRKKSQQMSPTWDVMRTTHQFVTLALESTGPPPPSWSHGAARLTPLVTLNPILQPLNFNPQKLQTLTVEHTQAQTLVTLLLYSPNLQAMTRMQRFLAVFGPGLADSP